MPSHYMSPTAPTGQLVTEAGLFNSFLPKVEITKVVLEYAPRSSSITPTQAEIIFDNNPHIDVEPQSESRGFEKRATLADFDNRTTKITIDLAIKIPRGQTIFPSVLEQDLIKDALKIYVSKIDTPDEFDQVSQNASPLFAARSPNPNKIILNFADFNDDTDIFRRDSYEAGQEFLLYTHRISFSATGVDAFTDINDLGIVTFALLDPASITFPNVPASATDLRNLLASVETLSGPIDSLRVLEDGVVVSTTDAFIISSPPHVGEVWNGPVSRGTDMRWITGGLPAGTTPQTLNRRSMRIPKVQDFRIAHKVDALPLDFSLTKNNILPRLRKDIRGNKLDINPACTSFSDIFLSRDIANNCRFFFSINWKKIILENSIFGGLYVRASSGELEQLLQQTKIKSLKIWRKRIAGSAEIGSTPYNKTSNGKNFQPVCKPKTYKENQIPQLIVEGIEDHSSPIPYNLVGYNSSYANGTGIENTSQEGAIKEVRSDRLHTGKLRHFSGVDGFIKAETDGYYKYEIELEILDGTVKQISRKLEGDGTYVGLQGLIRTIKNYYEAATRLSRSGGVAPWLSPYIDEPGGVSGSPGYGRGQPEHEFEPGQIHAGSFELGPNRFTREFIRQYTDSGTNELIESIRRTITNTLEEPGFVQILQFFSSTWSQPVENQITNALLDFLNPFSATPESINLVLQLMETMASNISSVLGVVYTKHMGTVNAVTGEQVLVNKTHIAAKNRTFKLYHQPSSFFNANLARDLGFDFLNTTDRSLALSSQPWHGKGADQGLYEIPKAYITQQAQLELRKFLTLNALARLGAPGEWYHGDVNPLDGHPTYFTPHTIITPQSTTLGKRYDMTDLLPIPTKVLGILAESLCERTDGDHNFLQDLILEWINQTGWGTGMSPRLNENLAAADLASYLDIFHNVSLFSLENRNLWMGRATQLTAGVRQTAQMDKMYYVGSRKNDQTERAGAYKFFMKILKFVDFDRIRKKKVPQFHLPFDMNNYEITNPQSAIAEAFDSTPFGERFELLRNAPVQVKALIWKRSSPNMSGWGQPLEVAVTDIVGNQSYNQYTTQIINRVEALDGYKRQPIVRDESGAEIGGGEFLLNSPIWTSLDQVQTRMGAGVKVVCRSVPYVNEKYLIRRDENYNLPTYDEYFIIMGS